MAGEAGMKTGMARLIRVSEDLGLGLGLKVGGVRVRVDVYVDRENSRFL